LSSDIAVIRNPRARTAPLPADLQRALAEASVGAEIYDLPGQTSQGWLDEIAARHAVLAAVGGDGTVSTIAAAAVRANRTLAVFPAGTLNHFARDAGIPADLSQAAALLTRHRAVNVDVGEVNDRFFVNNVSIGGYAQMVQERMRLEAGGRSRRVASIAAIARTWVQLRSIRARLSVDGTEIVRRSPLILVGNGAYVVSGLNLGARDEIADGKLSLYVTRGTRRLGALALPIRALLGSLEAYEQFEVFSANDIAMHVAARHLAVAIDGELVALATPLRFAIRRRA
jgi:diacylglycerol kinase family enzyme